MTKVKVKFQETAKYLLSYSELRFPDNPIRWFERENPLILEIGSGNGEFLLKLGKRQDFNLIGIEKSMYRVKEALHRLRNSGLNNIRLLCGPAEFFLRSVIPEDSLDQLFILFPDPWPKKAHVKRRLLSRPMLKLLSRRMKLGGLITVVTDHQGYRDWLIEQVPDKLYKISFTLGFPTDLPDTRYSRKWASMNRDIYVIKLTLRERVAPESWMKPLKLVNFFGEREGEGEDRMFIVKLEGNSDVVFERLRRSSGRIVKLHSEDVSGILKVMDVIVCRDEAWAELLGVLYDKLSSFEQGFLMKVRERSEGELEIRVLPRGQVIVTVEIVELFRELISELVDGLMVRWSNLKGIEPSQK